MLICYKHAESKTGITYDSFQAVQYFLLGVNISCTVIFETFQTFYIQKQLYNAPHEI